MKESVTLTARITVNVFDVAGLYETAVASYCVAGTREQAEEFLGTPDQPNLVNCLVEIWAEHCPASAGYEFVNYE